MRKLLYRARWLVKTTCILYLVPGSNYCSYNWHKNAKWAIIRICFDWNLEKIYCAVHYQCQNAFIMEGCLLWYYIWPIKRTPRRTPLKTATKNVLSLNSHWLQMLLQCWRACCELVKPWCHFEDMQGMGRRWHLRCTDALWCRRIHPLLLISTFPIYI